MNNNSERIVFLGTPIFAVPALEALMRHDHTPIAIITAPDRPAGRGLKLAPSPVSAYATDIRYTGIVLKPEKIDEKIIESVKTLKPTLGIVVAYGLILPQAFLDIFPKGVLNIHPSLLPKYRGASPLQNQILGGDSVCGVSIIRVDSKMDHGPIVEQISFPVDPATITYSLLHDVSAQKGAEALLQAIVRLSQNPQMTPTPQDDAAASFTRLFKKEDGLIDWSKSAKDIDRMVRALNPWPGTFTFLNGTRIKILKTSVERTQSDKAQGTLFEHEGSLYAACGAHLLRIHLLQKEDEKVRDDKEFIRLHQHMLPLILTGDSSAYSQQ